MLKRDRLRDLPHEVGGQVLRSHELLHSGETTPESRKSESHDFPRSLEPATILGCNFSVIRR
jgi:hypothetical protein